MNEQRQGMAQSQAIATQSFRTDLLVLILLAAARLVFHLLTNHQYGFHRDELATLDDARHLAWGFVAYPPLTPLIARAALEWFGSSLVAVRFFSGLAQAIAMVLTGLMARTLGGVVGRRWWLRWRWRWRRFRC